MTGKVALIASRTIEAALIILGVLVLVVTDTSSIILVWDLLAIVYLAIRISRLRRSGRGRPSAGLTHGLGGRAGLLFTIFTSAVGIVAGLSIVLSPEGDKLYASTVGIPAVMFAWGILHFGYAERYSQTYYANPSEPVLSFPNTVEPTFVDFTYFSFTMGATFSVSDVETQTPRIRLQVLSHSILSFIYNTVTIGIAVSVISG
jgi:uncharacterized membrane protein